MNRNTDISLAKPKHQRFVPTFYTDIHQDTLEDLRQLFSKLEQRIEMESYINKYGFEQNLYHSFMAGEDVNVISISNLYSRIYRELTGMDYYSKFVFEKYHDRE